MIPFLEGKHQGSLRFGLKIQESGWREAIQMGRCEGFKAARCSWGEDIRDSCSQQVSLMIPQENLSKHLFFSYVGTEIPNTLICFNN